MKPKRNVLKWNKNTENTMGVGPMLKVRCDHCDEMNYSSRFVTGDTCCNCNAILSAEEAAPVRTEKRICYDDYPCQDNLIECEECEKYKNLLRRSERRANLYKKNKKKLAQKTTREQQKGVLQRCHHGAFKKT
jgi:hypothetical protein